MNPDTRKRTHPAEVRSVCVFSHPNNPVDRAER